jgi:hypothetical protein
MSPVCLPSLLFFFSKNIEFNDFNGALFTIRGRALNNFVYYLSQIVGSYAIGFLLDRESYRRRTRAFMGWSILFGMVFIVHIWGYFYQKSALVVVPVTC